MKLLVSCDAHLLQTSDGGFWSTAIYGNAFWRRYLNVFDSVRIVARAKPIDEKPHNAARVDSDNVEVYPVAFFQGPVQLTRTFLKIQRQLKGAYAGCDAALFRMPSQTAQMAYWHLPKGMPFAGEIVYDPYDDAFKKNENMIARGISRLISHQLSRFCLAANGVAYVTEESIQKHYPSRARAFGENSGFFEAHYSTITLEDSAYTAPRDYCGKERLVLAMSCAAMNSERKGEKTLIATVKKVRDRGYDVSAVLIGDGRLRPSFEQYARDLHVEEHVRFTGLLASSNDVKKELEEADVFVFPTQGEGLPRGILEAMAVGLPVLSTPVGGIPEIINPKYLFDPLDAQAFADEICRLIECKFELNEMSVRNYNRSIEFNNQLLQARRDEFYRKLLQCCCNQFDTRRNSVYQSF